MKRLLALRQQSFLLEVGKIRIIANGSVGGIVMITTSAALGYVAVAAGIAAVIKILFSGSGRLRLPGFTAQWGR